MGILAGKSVFGGIAIGRVSIFTKDDQIVKRVKTDNPDEEMKRFHKAAETAKTQLHQLYEKALKEVGEDNATIFEVHQMMLEDMDYVEAIEHSIISQEVNAEFAVASTGDNFSRMFAEMEDDYFKARAVDVKDISNRVVAILQGRSTGIEDNDEPSIIFADDLTPSETVQLDKSHVLAFVTRHGSVNSHTAILARTMNIPALISVDFPGDIDGRLAVVDGYHGLVYIDPEEDVLQKFRVQQETDSRKKQLLQELKGKDNITLDGKSIRLYANIGGVGDVAEVLKNDAGGIGLFRSEFLYLGRDDFPSEEDQFQAYKTVAANMAGKKVIIRTLDIGADKQVDYFHLDKEENPALGYRAIRICLKQPEIFRTQLRAILRASHYGRIAIMFPMIISVEEVREVKKLVEEVKAELDSQELPYDKEIELGVMIETPAAVMISDLLAPEVDFFSIGTNDLTQYTLAIDRQNPKLDDFYDPHHEAVLRMLQMVVDNGHKGGAWVGICGELAADTSLTETFLRMGLDELSVSPAFILPVRQTIRSLNLNQS